MNWFVFCSMTSRNIIQRKLVFSPVGWKSWRVANISIKIMQSVELWLSFCGIVTVSFPSINLALCRFVASSLLNYPIRRIHFSQLFKKCPGFVFLNKWWHTHILWMCDMIVYISSIFLNKTLSSRQNVFVAFYGIIKGSHVIIKVIFTWISISR